MWKKEIKNYILKDYDLIILFFINIAQIAVVIFMAGLPNLAILGILLSFIFFFRVIDDPFISNLKDYTANSFKKGKNFQVEFNAAYRLLLVSSAVIFILLAPVTVFLAIKVYGNHHLIMPYMKTLLFYLILRTNIYLSSLITPIMGASFSRKPALIGSATALSVTVLFLELGMGITSVIFGNFIGQLAQYIILTSYAKTFVNYSTAASVEKYLEIMNSFNFLGYHKNILRIIVFGALFMSTFYLTNAILVIFGLFFFICVRTFWPLRLCYQKFQNLPFLYVLRSFLKENILGRLPVRA